MLRKYNEGNWEQRRMECDAEITNKYRHNPPNPEATVHKVSEQYFDKITGEMVMSRVTFTSANGKVRTVIMSLVGEDGIQYVRAI